MKLEIVSRTPEAADRRSDAEKWMGRASFYVAQCAAVIAEEAEAIHKSRIRLEALIAELSKPKPDLKVLEGLNRFDRYQRS